MNLNTRINSLYKTGVPSRFVINFAKMVKKSHETEKEIHVQLKKLRINPCREFFKCPIATIKSVFDKIEGVWWNKEEDDHGRVVSVVVKSKRKKLFRKAKHFKFNYKV